MTVTVVAVAAVAVGGFVASRRTPESQAGAAAPLVAPVRTPSPLTFTGAKVVPIDAAKLPVGDAPHLTYLRDRTVHGGAGTPVKVPGSVEIDAVARLHDAVLTIQLKTVRDPALVILDASGKQIERVPLVDSLVTSTDGQAAAYASGGRYTTEGKLGDGGTVYYRRSAPGPVKQLAQPKVFDLRVLGVSNDTVYFQSSDDSAGPWNFYRWQVDQPTPTRISSVRSPIAVSGDGTLVAGLASQNDSGMCTTLMTATTGSQRWRSCQYQLTRFSPGNTFTIGIPAGSDPYGDLENVALDPKTGDQLRKWTGPSLRDARPEDGDHVVLAWHDRPEPGSRSALVRCTVSSGKCELATPLASGTLLLGS
ncbi:hypothetical protein [Kribbella ginsengisoli]|uniref:Uncharacterized protein n=1 Tax=Kribbella ginsengisoli TaxID=363865 RepID=A0ABP6XYU6_9ACTN